MRKFVGTGVNPAHYEASRCWTRAGCVHPFVVDQRKASENVHFFRQFLEFFAFWNNNAISLTLWFNAACRPPMLLSWLIRRGCERPNDEREFNLSCSSISSENRKSWPATDPMKKIEKSTNKFIANVFPPIIAAVMAQCNNTTDWNKARLSVNFDAVYIARWTHAEYISINLQ